MMRILCVYNAYTMATTWPRHGHVSLSLSLSPRSRSSSSSSSSSSSIDIIIRTHSGSSSCAGAALTFLACLVFSEPIIPAMVAMKAKQATKAMKAAKKAMNIPMNDITKAIAEQTELKPERVEAVFDALFQIAKQSQGAEDR